MRLAARSFSLFVLCALILSTGATNLRLSDSCAYAAVVSDPVNADTFYLGYTYQDHGGRRSRRNVVVDDSAVVHIAWVYQPLPLYGFSTGAYFNTFSSGAVGYSSPGCYVGQAYDPWGPLWSLSMDVDSISPVLLREREAQPIIQHRFPDSCGWTQYELLATTGGYSPAISIQKTFATSLYHLIGGQGGGGLSYWRTPIGPQTRRTVLTAGVQSWEVVTSRTSNKVAIVVSTDLGIHYYESLDAGLTWGGGPGFGVSHSIGATQPTSALSIAYDYNDELHIVFETHVGSHGVTLKHWSASAGISTIAEATWEYSSVETAVRNISYPQLGVGVGDNLNNLYVAWSQFGTSSDNSDVSSGGQSNADVYLSISTNGGESWDPARNLTNTSSPGCNGDCWSEIIPSMAETVDSNIHLRFIRDLQSGISTSDTLTRTRNPVYYMRVQTPAAIAAPNLAGLPSQIGPLYLKFRSEDTIVITIENTGTAVLDFSLTEDETWFSFVPGLDSVGGSIPPSGSPLNFLLAVDVTGLPSAIHQGTISAISNDPDSDTIPVNVVADMTSNIIAHLKIGETGGTDCWGWTGEDGSEYALMGVSRGIAVVDVSRRRLVQIVPGPGPCGSTWRDIKTYRHYAYAVSECTGTNEGMMVIDLQYLPDSVHFVTAYAPLSIDQSHNITIDTAKGYAYLAGPSTSGIWTRSLLNPESPTHVFSMPGDCHDLFARNDTLWVAEGNDGSFAVWNVANKTSPSLIARVTIPSSGYVHNVWISKDGQIAATTEETTGKTIKFWDISDLTDVQLLGQYLGSSQLAHNVHIEDNFAIIAHYTNGVTILDITNPAAPTVYANFDTYPAADAPEFSGCWGVYPHTKSGQIYSSNMNGDLYILQYDELMTTCDCPCHGDPQCDGTRADIQDVVGAIETVFRGGATAQSPDCPMPDVDTDCNGVPDIVDVIKMIDVAFRGVDPAAAFCNPCL